MDSGIALIISVSLSGIAWASIMPLFLLVRSSRMSEQIGQLEAQLKQMKQEARPDGIPDACLRGAA